MSLLKTKGIIIKQYDYGESNRILNIFTKDQGIIKAVLYGAKSMKNKNSRTAQFLTYADFILSNSGRELYTIKNCEPIECFFKIHEDIEKVALCTYMADLIYTLINLNSPDENILNLFLNCCYALAYKDIDNEKIRAVFELRVMAYSGYLPEMYRCTKCFSEENITAFSPVSGGVVCDGCVQPGDYMINADIYYAIRYILTAEGKKMMSFSASDSVMHTVSEIAEKYVEAYTEKNFSSLDYYKKISGKTND